MSRMSNIVTVDRTGLITSIASGKTEKNFYDAITNGMYAMEISDKDATTKVVAEENSLVDIDDFTGDDCHGEAGSTIDNSGDIALDICGVYDDEFLSNNPFGVTGLSELDTLRKKTDRVSNPIVSRVLEQASAAMGITTSTKDTTEQPEDTVGHDE